MKPWPAEQYARFVEAVALGAFADQSFAVAADYCGLRDYDFRGSPLLALAAATAGRGRPQ